MTRFYPLTLAASHPLDPDVPDGEHGGVVVHMQKGHLEGRGRGRRRCQEVLDKTNCYVKRITWFVSFSW